MHVRRVLTGVLGVLITAAAAIPAQAQTRNSGAFSGVSLVAAPEAAAPRPALPALSFDAAVAPRQASEMPINGIVFGGLNTGYGGAGFAAGGGVQVGNVGNREEFGLQFDALVSNVGECLGCDPLNRDDFSAWQFAVSGAFLFKFRETSTGWRPFAGGGVVYTRFSFSFDDDFVCDIINVDCSESINEVGIQAQGGIARGNLHFEGRVQGTAGGAFIALVGYRFGQ